MFKHQPPYVSLEALEPYTKDEVYDPAAHENFACRYSIIHIPTPGTREHFLQVSQLQRWGTIQEYVDLCRTHVRIMSRRRDRRYELETQGADPDDLVPPAIFHTLVENAITHDDTKPEQVTLKLHASPDGGRVRYVFEAPCSGSVSAAIEGTGLRYVRARLEESFGRDWSLASGPAGGVWRTELSIPRRRRP